MPRTVVPATLTAVDLDATRARAVRGPADAVPRLLPLSDEGDLPLALSLEGRRPDLGRAGQAILRQSPHLVCHDFLAALGTPTVWSAGRHKLDAARALAILCDHLRECCGDGGVCLALPGYLSSTQANLVQNAARKARLALLGTVTAPVAAALAAHEHHPWLGLALVLDADDHALTAAAVMADEDQARLLRVQPFPRLSLLAWKARLLDVVAERCVRHSRRDPRDSAPAEQSLFDQFDGVFDRCRHGQVAEVSVRAAAWFQNLFLPPDEVKAACSRLLRQTLNEVQDFLAETAFQGPRRVILTDAAARLPGLEALLRDWVADLVPPAPVAVAVEEDAEDFGEDLVPESLEPAALVCLPPDAVVCQTHALAARFHDGSLPREHLELAAPLATPVPLDAGPVRLNFLDRDYPLDGGAFVLGRQPGCDLVFDSAAYPMVSARHCEIGREARGFVLRDRSRNGTLVNDRYVTGQVSLQPGDWIRLGPGGPALRFLGHAGDGRKLVTTA
jgi:hypothetical protein